MKRLLSAVLGVWVLGSCVPSRAGESVPCDAQRARVAHDDGWRVQLDPETGTYSMPTSPTTTGTTTSARAAGDLVVQPGTTAAGGWKVQLGDRAAAEERQ